MQLNHDLPEDNRPVAILFDDETFTIAKRHAGKWVGGDGYVIGENRTKVVGWITVREALEMVDRRVAEGWRAAA